MARGKSSNKKAVPVGYICPIDANSRLSELSSHVNDIKKDQKLTHKNFMKLHGVFLDLQENQAQMKEQIGNNQKGIQNINNTLDNVNANGRRGLGESIHDLYKAVDELKVIEAAHWYNKPLKEYLVSKWLRILFLLSMFLLLTSVLHSLGIELDFQSILKALGIGVRAL